MAPKNQLTAQIQAMALLKQNIQRHGEKIEELQSRISTLQRKKRNSNTAYQKANNEYARIWNRMFAAKIFEILAPELRDVVYYHLIGGAPRAHILQHYRTLPTYEPRDYFFHVELVGRRGRARGLGNELQHYFTEEYMGQEFAIGIAKVFHRHAEYNVFHTDDVNFLLHSGPLMIHPSCRPLDYIRAISVCVSMEPFLSTTDYGQAVALQKKAESKAKKEDYEKQVGWLSDLAGSKQVSRLRVTLSVEARASSVMEKYEAILLPHIQELVERGCRVYVSWLNMDRSSWIFRRMVYDRTKLVSASQLESNIAKAFAEELSDA